MRRRQASLRSVPEGWLQPRRSGRSTTIGNLDSPWRASVDPAGLVTLAGATWSLDWWVGAEDRWHLPSQEVAIRQSLVGAGPVVETRLRVPSGDAVHRAYAARDQAGNEAVVVEVENASKIPFAIALALRPYDHAGQGRLTDLALDGTTVWADGAVVLTSGRAPGRVAFSDSAHGDSAATVLDGRADAVGPVTVSCTQGLAQGALLFPLAHTATLRVVLPLAGPASRELPAPDAFPSGPQVASGWRAHVGAGARVEPADRRLRDAVAATTRHLLLGQPDPPVAAALDLLGFPDDAARALTADPLGLARDADAGVALDAVVTHWALTRDSAFARQTAEVVGTLVGRVARQESSGPRDAAALADAADLLEAADEPRAAADVRSVRRRLADRAQPPAGEPTAELEALLATASATWTWSDPSGQPDLVAAARFVTLVRGLLVEDRHGGLALGPVVPESWLGQGWELHGAPTRFGALSYAVRWHGDRPALLWELDRLEVEKPVVLTVPGLDPAWSSIEARGEALLGPVAVPDRAARRGLTIPVSIEPMTRRAR